MSTRGGRALTAPAVGLPVEVRDDENEVLNIDGDVGPPHVFEVVIVVDVPPRSTSAITPRPGPSSNTMSGRDLVTKPS